MKNIFRSALLLLFPTIAITACDSDDPIPAVKHTPRTVLLYMVAQNNLSSNASRDLQEIKTAVLNGDLGDSRLIIYHDSYNASPALKEFDSDGNLISIINYDDKTLSVSSERMLQVIADVKAKAPADRYGLILWGHGTGYVQDGIEKKAVPTNYSEISPLSFGGETQPDNKSYWMNTTTMASVLDGKEFDWIYFDCCFMAGVEVAYELRNVTDYIVASATEIPAEGMPYDKTLKYLMPANSDLIAAANETFRHYDSMSGMLRTCTISVIRTAAMDELARSMRALYPDSKGLPDDYEPQAFQTPGDHRQYNWSYYDLQHYATALAGKSTLYTKVVPTAIGQTVIAAYATPMLWSAIPLSNHCGLSTLIIKNDDDPQIDKFGYRELQWWTDVVEPSFNNP